MQSLYLEGGLFWGRVLGNVMPPAASALPVRREMMIKATILWVSDSSHTSIAARLEKTGYAVLVARLREALAVLFVNRSIDFVLVYAGANTSELLTLARGLRALRPDVPIFLINNATEMRVEAPPIKDCFVVGEDQIIPQLSAAALRPVI